MSKQRSSIILLTILLPLVLLNLSVSQASSQREYMTRAKTHRALQEKMTITSHNSNDFSEYVLVSSTFVISDEDWSIIGMASPIQHATTGGNPDGYIFSTDDGNGGWYFVAPAKFLGDQHYLYGGTLEFDLKGEQASFGNQAIFIHGAGITIAYFEDYHWTTDWQSRQIIVHERAKWHVGSLTGTIATSEQVQQALSNVLRIRISGDYISGSETSSIDNVFLYRNRPPFASSISIQPSQLQLGQNGSIGIKGVHPDMEIK